MERIGSEVERQLTRGGGRDAIPLATITSAWPDAVGETVARNAWPLRLGRDGTLHVATTSATWAFELDRLAAEIADALSSRLPPEVTVERMRFAVGPVPEPPGVESLSAKAPEATSEEAAAAAAAAAAIDDHELRELVVRAARASLARARSGRRFC